MVLFLMAVHHLSRNIYISWSEPGVFGPPPNLASAPPEKAGSSIATLTKPNKYFKVVMKVTDPEAGTGLMLSSKFYIKKNEKMI